MCLNVSNCVEDYGNGIPLYCVKNLCPLIGDHQFSSRVKSIFGEPVLSADPKNQKPEPQVSAHSHTSTENCT